MITRLVLENFKNFKKAELAIGPLTLIVGTNASGKSNIRDAFRFLHGLSRGYTLADIIGEKWIEGGVLQWKGIRGGTREATFQASATFALEVAFRMQDREQSRDARYRIEVNVGANGKPPLLVSERLVVPGRGNYIYEAISDDRLSESNGSQEINVLFRKEPRKGFIGPTITFPRNQPILSQIPESPKIKLPTVKEFARHALAAFRSMRFLDLNPDQMRTPSLPGQGILGDRGENLSSVLQAVCENEQTKRALIQWIHELTPMDASDFEFPPDQTGKILVSLVEKNGQKTSAYSASDGTLRFLAMIAALIGPDPARFYFLEELENGIHPTRLHLLLQLIETKAAEGNIQIVASTHSPHLLAILSAKSRADASLVYRLEQMPDARIKRLLDIPTAREVVEKQNLSRLFASGWLEDAVAFTESQETDR